MDRQKMLEETAQKFYEENCQSTFVKIGAYYKEHRREVEHSFLEAVEQGLRVCREKQKKLGFISISFLESSFITHTYDVQFAFYNNLIYADENPVYVYWAPTFIYEMLEKDIKALESFLKPRIVRLRPYEVQELRNQYILNFHFLAVLLLRGLLEKVFTLEEFHLNDKEDQVKIISGKYMEKQVEICIWEADL